MDFISGNVTVEKAERKKESSFLTGYQEKHIEKQKKEKKEKSNA